MQRAVSRILPGPDQDTVIHELFFRVLSDKALRERYRGGSLATWLATLARNQALDHRRRLNREHPLEQLEKEIEPTADLEGALDAARIVERFKRECLPLKWERVFEARFVQQLDQRAAASELGIARTTLAYQELRIRSLFKRFVLRLETP